MGLQRIQQRGEPNRLEREALAFHERVRQGYRALAAQDSERMIRLDAEAPPDELEQEIQKILQKSLGQPLS